MINSVNNHPESQVLSLFEGKKKVLQLWRKGLSKEDARAIVVELDMDEAVATKVFEYFESVFRTERQVLGDLLQLYKLEDSIPPQFELVLKGKKFPIPVSHTTLMNPKLLDNQILLAWGVSVLDGMTPAQWRVELIALFESGGVRKRKTIADIKTQVVGAVKTLMGLRGEARSYLDLEAGSFVTTKHRGLNYYGFNSQALLRWIREYLKYRVPDDRIDFWLRRFGMRSLQVAVENHRPVLSIIPADKADSLGARKVRGEDIPDWMR